MAEKRQFSVYLSTSLIRRMRRAALSHEASLSAFVERALPGWLERLDQQGDEKRHDIHPNLRIAPKLLVAPKLRIALELRQSIDMDYHPAMLDPGLVLHLRAPIDTPRRCVGRPGVTSL